MQDIKTPIKASIKVQGINGTLSRMSILNVSTLNDLKSLYNPIILREFNYLLY